MSREAGQDPQGQQVRWKPRLVGVLYLSVVWAGVEAEPQSRDRQPGCLFK